MKDCIVIGGGLIGMLTARELHAAGLSVTILEKNATCQGSSWAGGGILSPLYPWRYPEAVSVLARWSQDHYLALAEILEEESGIDAQWTRSGLLILGAKDAGDGREWARAHDVRIRDLSPDELLEHEPALGIRDRDGLLFPDIAHVRNPRFCRALKTSLLRRGVQFYEDTAVHAFIVREGRMHGIRTIDGAECTAGCVVVAAGAWSGDLLQGLDPGTDVPVEPVRGQMLLFRAHPGLLQQIVLYDDHYVIPRRDGRVLAGSTLERVGFDDSTTSEARQELLRTAVEIIPSLAGVEIERHWAGLRPGSPTGVPFIGPHPAIEGLYINAGHYRNGVILGPASARLLSDMITGRPGFTEFSPYSLVPFAGAGT